MPSTPKKLNARHKIFVEAYLATKHVTKAAEAAGYSAKTAYSIGSELLKKPEIKAAVDAGVQEQIEAHREITRKKLSKFKVSRERIIRELETMAFSSYDDFVTVTERGVRLKTTAERAPRYGHAIKKISESTSQHGGSQSLELHDKKGALELLAKMEGYVVERKELSGPDGKPIKVQKLDSSLSDAELDAELEALEKRIRAKKK